MMPLAASAAVADRPDLAAQRTQAEAKILLQIAEASLADGKYVEAKQQFIDILILDPSNARAKRGLIRADRVIASTSAKATDIDVKSAANLIEMSRRLQQAKVQLDTGNIDGAVSRLKKVRMLARSMPDDERAAKALAEAQTLLKQIEDRRAAEKSGRNDAEVERKTIRKAKADKLYKQAQSEYGHNHYSAARQLVNSAVQLDPNHRKAIELQKTLDEKIKQRQEQDRKEKASNAFDQAFREVDKAAIPTDRVVQLPPDWDARVARTHRPEKLTSGFAAEWQEQMSLGLCRQVSFDGHGTPLRDVISYLREASGMNLMIDPNCAAANEPVGFGMKNVTLRSALNRLCDFTNTHWAMADKMILISKEPIQDDAFPYAYDIHDLLVRPRDFKSTRGRMHALVSDTKTGNISTGVYSKKADQDAERKLACGTGWANFIRKNIAPGTWHGSVEGGGSSQNTIAFRNGRLVVTHTPEVHRQILELLDNFRRARNIQVCTLCRFIDMNKDFLDYIGIETGGLGTDVSNPSGYDGTGGHVPSIMSDWPTDRGAGFHATGSSILDRFGEPHPDAGTSRRYGDWDVRGGTVASGAFDAKPQGDVANNFFYHDASQPSEGLILNYYHLANYQVRAILEAVVKRRKGTILDAPRITCFNGQRANIVVTVEESYISNVSEDEQPELGGLTHGVVLEVVPYVSADQKYITLELLPIVNKLLGWTDYEAQSVAVTAAGVLQQTGAEIRLPYVSVRAVQTTVTVPDGGTMLIGGMATSTEDYEIVSVPFIRKIPIIKWLFSGRGRTKMQTSLVILVRADILIQGTSEPRRGE